MKRLLTDIISILFFIGLPVFTGAQTGFTTQDELKKKADEYFKMEDYSEALPLYSQLVSIYPKDPLYNYRFGVSVLFADRRETEKPIKYLQFASTKKDVDISVNYYLGMAYHNNYRFSEAILKYNIYKKEAGTKTIQKLKIDRLIEICNNARELLTHFSTLYVLKKTEVNYKDFFRSYDVGDISGKILVKPEVFKTPLDKKREKLALMYYSAETKEAYFSSYGKDGLNGKDIYKVCRLKDGSWSKPENLGTGINTPYDEDFPFMTSDSTLYFSSKGSTTIGGYDIFSSKLSDAGEWSQPENLNFPINTPFDDIMFVPDSSKQYAYFSSDRSSLEGMITVYKVRIDRRIQVAENITFDSTNADTSKVSVAGAQVVEFLKESAVLDVNANENMFKENTLAENTTSTNYKAKEYEVDSLKNLNDLTNSEIIALAEKQAKEAREELKGYKDQKDAANAIALNRKQQADKKYQQAALIKSKAENINDESVKQSEIAKANTLQSEADQLNKESTIAAKIADDLKEQVSVKQKESDEANQYAKDIIAAVQENSTDTSVGMLTKMIDKLQSSEVDTNYIATIDPGIEFIKEKENKSEELNKDAKRMQDEVNLLKLQADNYRKDAANTRKKSQKEEYNKKAVEIDDEVKGMQAEVDAGLQKAEKLQDQADSARSQSAIFANVVDDILNKNTANSVVAINTNNQATTNNTNTQTQVNNAATTTQNTSSIKQLTSEEQKIKKELQLKTVEIGKDVQKVIDTLKIRSENAYAIAYDKNRQSNTKQTQADDLIAKASENADTIEKEKELQQAAELHKESITLARKAVISYRIGKQMEDTYKEKTNDNVAINEAVKEIRTLIDSNNISEANEKYTDLQKTAVIASNISLSNSEYQTNISNELDAKENELELVNEEVNNKQVITDSLMEQAIKLRQEANNETKQSKKKNLQQQAEKVEALANLSQTKVDTSRSIAEKLKIEVGELKLKINYTTSLMNEISDYKTSASQAVDKTELEKNVNEYENNDIFAEVTPANNANVVAENITSGQNSSKDSTTNVQVDIANNNPTLNNNAVALNNTVSNKANTDTIASLTTPAEQEESKADLMDKTVVTINNNITALQNDLAKEKDPNRKKEITSEISDMQKASESLINAAKTSHQLALKLNNSVAVTDVTIIDDSTLVANLENDAANDMDNALQKRLDAKTTTNQAEKASLKNEADSLETIAKARQLNALEISGIANKNKYYANNIQLSAIKVVDDKNNLFTTAILLEDESKMYFKKGQELRDSVRDDMIYVQKKTLLDEARANELIAINKQTKAIDIYAKVAPQLANNNSSDNKVANNTPANTAIANNTNVATTVATNTTANNTVANKTTINNTATNNTVANKTTVNNAAANNTSNDTNNIVSNKTSPTALSNNGKDVKNTTAAVAITNNDFKGIYITPAIHAPLNVDTANLIPLDPELPSGVVFKIQICAVKRHCAPDVFKGVTPLVGESTPAGLIRYMAGLFAKFDDARTSRDQLRTMGYNDAFIVAYYNGKRITIAEALALLKADNTLNKTYADLNNKSYVSTGTANTAAETKATAGLSNPLANIKGLFYSVQVGVYIRPVTSAQLFNITPLYDEYMANGYIRYLSGIYTSLQEAVTAKNAIVVKGVKDAFVVVYNNGKKITFAEAKDMLAANATLANVVKPTAATANNNTAITVQTPLIVVKDTATTLATADKTGIVFKVQLGAYKNDVPVDVVNKFLDVVTDGSLQHTKDTDGLTVYTSGRFTDYKQANDYKAALVAKGIADAFVIAYQNGKKIAVAKAVELLK